MGAITPNTRPPLRSLSSWKQGAGVYGSLTQESRIPASGDLCVTCDQAPYQCHSERSEESKAVHQIHRSFADRGFGFFTSLRSGQNDSWSASFWDNAGVIQRSPSAGMVEQALSLLIPSSNKEPAQYFTIRDWGVRNLPTNQAAPDARLSPSGTSWLPGGLSNPPAACPPTAILLAGAPP